jgi:hypothetical protein
VLRFAFCVLRECVPTPHLLAHPSKRAHAITLTHTHTHTHTHTRTHTQTRARRVQGQVNAKDVYEIDRFGTNETRGVKITPEDEKKYYRHFDLVHAQHWQEEVVRLYDMITAQADKDDRALELRLAKSPAEPAAPGALIQGYLLKHSHSMFRSWNKRYVRPYSRARAHTHTHTHTHTHCQPAESLPFRNSCVLYLLVIITLCTHLCTQTCTTQIRSPVPRPPRGAQGAADAAQTSACSQ